MNRLSRNALAGALAAAIALGMGAPAANAASHGHTKHTKHAHHAGHANPARHGRADQTKADRLGHAERKLAHEAARKSQFLGRVLGSNRLARLDDSVESSVRSNIQADQATLDGFAPSAAADSGSLQPAADQLHAMRPEVYNRIISELRLAAQLRSQATDTQAVTLDTTVAKLVTFTASTPRSELSSTQAELTRVDAAEDDAAEDGAAEDGATESGATDAS